MSLRLPDLWLCTSFLALCAMGWMTVYSASEGDLSLMSRHSLYLLLSVFCVFLVAQLDSDDIFILSLPFYAIVLLALVLLLLLDGSGEVKRWIRVGTFSVQPAEFMKLALPMCIAWCLGRRRGEIKIVDVVVSLLLIALPVWLVVRQPDLGTALVIAAAGCAALWVGGLSWRVFGSMVGVVLLLSPLTWGILHEYQRKRILYFLSPESDPLGAGYHVIQSIIAIGSGGMYGKGWRQGTQSHLDFLPERTTDFAFSVFCEEFGFTGFILMLTLLLSLLYRGLTIAINSPTVYGRILASSLCFTIAICAYVNMGMTSGQLPVVGLPLPFVSMGGTALLTAALSVGVLCSIHRSTQAKRP